MRTYHWEWPCDRCGGRVIIEEESNDNPPIPPPPRETVKDQTGTFCEKCKLAIERDWLKEITLQAMAEYHTKRSKIVEERRRGRIP